MTAICYRELALTAFCFQCLHINVYLNNGNIARPRRSQNGDYIISYYYRRRLIDHLTVYFKFGKWSEGRVDA